MDAFVVRTAMPDDVAHPMDERELGLESRGHLPGR
jgi:hypothetical protein